MNKKALRGQLLSFHHDPFLHGLEASYQYLSDGAVIIENGIIIAVGEAATILAQYPDIACENHGQGLIMAGFVDAHVHYPQTQMIAAYGEQLLDWLNEYTFVVEQSFANPEHAQSVAKVFLQQLLCNGVTSAAVFSTVHRVSVDALLGAASQYNMRMMTGKVCMDRFAPDALLDNAQSAYDDSKALIEKWHGKGRNEYVLTPRFAPTSTHEQLCAISALAAEYPDVLIQSHLSENLGEMAWVKSLFPQAIDYTDVYDGYGLLRPRAIYGHGIHLSERELAVLSERQTAIAHCPTSNFFLGSGCFHVLNAKKAERPVHVALGSDVGAGTSFSMLQTMNEAYKAAQMNHAPYSALHAFYLASLGGAKALGLDDKIGSLAVGKEADIVVLDMRSTELIDYRMQYAEDLTEALFIQMILGDDRAIAATYIAGEKLHG